MYFEFLDALHGIYGNWYDWFYWSYRNIRLVYVNLGLFGFLLETCYDRYNWLSWLYLNAWLNSVIAVDFSFYP